MNGHGHQHDHIINNSIYYAHGMNNRNVISKNWEKRLKCQPLNSTTKCIYRRWANEEKTTDFLVFLLFLFSLRYSYGIHFGYHVDDIISYILHSHMTQNNTIAIITLNGLNRCASNDRSDVSHIVGPHCEK